MLQYTFYEKNYKNLFKILFEITRGDIDQIQDYSKIVSSNTLKLIQYMKKYGIIE